jgi:uncharacterized protein (DUF433 family)
VPKTEPEIVAQNPAEVPLYTVLDSARYLRVPVWAYFALDGRFRGWPEPEFFFYHFRRGSPYPAVFDDDLAFTRHPDDRARLSFRRFADLFVRTATLQVLVEWSRAGDTPRDRWENLYHTIWRGLEDTHRQPVPFDDDPIEERAEALAEPYTRRLSDDQSALLKKWLTLRLRRVEVKDGAPVRIYPFSRDPADKSPRTIALDPLVRFGRPTIAGRGVPTDTLFERHQAGDAVAELAADYDLTVAEVEEAIRYESLPVVPLFPLFGW